MRHAIVLFLISILISIGCACASHINPLEHKALEKSPWGNLRWWHLKEKLEGIDTILKHNYRKKLLNITQLNQLHRTQENLEVLFKEKAPTLEVLKRKYPYNEDKAVEEYMLHLIKQRDEGEKKNMPQIEMAPTKAVEPPLELMLIFLKSFIALNDIFFVEKRDMPEGTTPKILEKEKQVDNKNGEAEPEKPVKKMSVNDLMFYLGFHIGFHSKL